MKVVHWSTVQNRHGTLRAEERAREHDLWPVFRVGAANEVLGCVSPGASDDEIVRAFAFALPHDRYGYCYLNVTKGKHTDQITVAWDHPELVKARNVGVHRSAMAELAPEGSEAFARIAHMTALADAADAEDFALSASEGARRFAYYVVDRSDVLRQRVDGLRDRNPDSEYIRAIHRAFHEEYAALLAEYPIGLGGVTHAKVRGDP